MVELVRLGAVLDSRLWLVEGGVWGRELVLERLLGRSDQQAWTGGARLDRLYNELKLRMSACE